MMLKQTSNQTKNVATIIFTTIIRHRCYLVSIGCFITIPLKYLQNQKKQTGLMPICCLELFQLKTLVEQFLDSFDGFFEFFH